MSSTRRIKGPKKQIPPKTLDEEPQLPNPAIPAEPKTAGPRSVKGPVLGSSSVRNMTESELLTEFDREFVVSDGQAIRDENSREKSERYPATSAARNRGNRAQAAPTNESKETVLSIITCPKVQNVPFLKEIIQFVGRISGPRILIFPRGIFSDQVSVSSLSVASSTIKSSVSDLGASANHLAVITCGSGPAEEIISLGGIVKQLSSTDSSLSEGITFKKDGDMLQVTVFGSQVPILLSEETDLMLFDITANKKTKKLSFLKSPILELSQNKNSAAASNLTFNSEMRPHRFKIADMDAGGGFCLPEFSARFLPNDLPALAVLDEDRLTNRYLHQAASTLSRAVENSAAGTLCIHQLPTPQTVRRDTIDEQLAPWLERGLSRQKHIELEAVTFLPKLKCILPNALSTKPGLDILEKYALQQGAQYDEDAFESEFTPKPLQELSKMITAMSPFKVEKCYRFGEDGEEDSSEEDRNDLQRERQLPGSPEPTSQVMDTQTRDLMELENTWLEDEMMTHAQSPRQGQTPKRVRPFHSEPGVKKQPKFN